VEIYLITPPEASFLEELPDLLSNGVDRIQYRRTSLSDRERVEELKDLAPLCSKHRVPLIVNDRPDLALVGGADGVHLGADDLPVSSVKNKWPNLTVGATQRVEAPPEETADYLGLGPVFESGTKSVGHDPSGWDEVAGFIEKTDQPVYAIGGITPERCEGIPDDLSGICVIGAVWNRKDPVEGLRELRERLPE
jgi:thiamine-phosphate pyrophosphorylase